MHLTTTRGSPEQATDGLRDMAARTTEQVKGAADRAPEIEDNMTYQARQYGEKAREVGGQTRER